MYEERQLNSRNDPVEAKFAYLCTGGSCRLRNALLRETMLPLRDTVLKLVFRNTSQECWHICAPSGHFLILERAKNRKGLSRVNMMDGPFL
jgi:hypothetical protein